MGRRRIGGEQACRNTLLIPAQQAEREHEQTRDQQSTLGGTHEIGAVGRRNRSIGIAREGDRRASGALDEKRQNGPGDDLERKVMARQKLDGRVPREVQDDEHREQHQPHAVAARSQDERGRQQGADANEMLDTVEWQIQHLQRRAVGARHDVRWKRQQDAAQVLPARDVVLMRAVLDVAQVRTKSIRIAGDRRPRVLIFVEVTPSVRAAVDAQRLVEGIRQAEQEHVPLASAACRHGGDNGPASDDETGREQKDGRGLQCDLTQDAAGKKQCHGDQKRRNVDQQIGAKPVANAHAS